jgi:hypothetical protein
MGVDHCFATIQFFEQRRERRIAQPRVAVAGEHTDTIGFQRLEGVGDLLRRVLMRGILTWAREGTGETGITGSHGDSRDNGVTEIIFLVLP